MSKLLQVLLLCGFVVTCYSLNYEKEFDLFSLSDSYEQINQHLLNNVESDDLEMNMQEAKRWLDQKVRRSSNKRLATALELFNSLKTINGTCNRDSYDIVEANDYLSGHQAHNKGIGPVEETRIVKLVAHYGTIHAKKCIETYSKKIHQKYRSLKKENTEKIHLLADKLTWQPLENYGNVFYDVIEQLAGDSLYELQLKSKLGSEDGGFERQLDESILKELYEKYFVEPCREFIEINNDRLLEAIQYYEKWVRVDGSDELLSRLPYRYRVCDRILSDKEILFGKFRDTAMSRYNHDIAMDKQRSKIFSISL